MDEVIKPRNKALTKKEREKGRLKFWKRYGAWYAFSYKKNGRKSWIDKFDLQSNEDKQGW
jgi:hypothetical protein